MSAKTNKDLYVMKCIISTQKRIGKGVEGDPIRKLIQVFDLQGNLIAERDTWKEQNKT